MLTHPDLSDAEANLARRALLAATRGYGENRDLFENFPAQVAWTRAGLRAFDVPNEPFVDSARAFIAGERFPPLILVGERRDKLVCLEGHLRLTAYALVGFPSDVECLIGTAPAMGRWAK